MMMRHISVTLWIFFLDVGTYVESGTVCNLIDDVFCDYFSSAKSTFCTQKWARQNCQNMCGYTCVITKKQHKKGCDEPDHNRCRDFHFEGGYYCRQSWMQSNCRYFCGSCRTQQPSHYEEMIRPVLKVREVKPHVKKKKKMEKRDCSKSDHARCPDYKNYLNHYCQQTWMQNNCPHFCGTCPPATLVSNPFQGLSGRTRKEQKKKGSGYLIPGAPGNPLATAKKEKKTSMLEQIVTLLCKHAHKGCEQDDNFRCFIFKRVKYHVCHFDWMRENCKFMCGVCIPEKHVHYHFERLVYALKFQTGEAKRKQAQITAE